MSHSKLTELRIQAAESRKRTWRLIYEANSGHTGGDLSCADILTTLYFSKMNIDPENPEDPNRDRYIQSKGHAAEILWTTLKERGFYSEDLLRTFYEFKSPLIGHPNNDVPGIEMNTGSLGHGLAISVGIAKAAKIDNKSYQTYTLLGDGELAEGSVWEAALAASHFKLDNLTGIIDNNKLQITGNSKDVMSTEPLQEKWESFGWAVIEIDGNNINELLKALDTPHQEGKPKMIIANTIKGKGISFAENKAEWHHQVPTEEEYYKGIEELDNLIKELKNE